MCYSSLAATAVREIAAQPPSATHFINCNSAPATPAGSTLTPTLVLEERVVMLPSALRVVLLELERVVDFWMGLICPDRMPAPAASAEATAGSIPPWRCGVLAEGGIAMGLPAMVGIPPAVERFSYSRCS